MECPGSSLRKLSEGMAIALSVSPRVYSSLMTKKSGLQVAALFAGAGGLDLGFPRACNWYRPTEWWSIFKNCEV